MRAKKLVLLLLCLSTTGCTVTEMAVQNLIVAPWQYPVWMEKRREQRRNERLAREAWSSWCGQHSGASFSKDYQRGFEEGYADFLYAGAQCDPPSLPPRDYWRSEYQTPDGYRAICDWYSGFRDGTTTAREGPHAPWMKLPTALAMTSPAMLPGGALGPTPSSVPPATLVPTPTPSPAPPVSPLPTPAAAPVNGPELLPQATRSTPQAQLPPSWSRRF